jgi:hypothetical protein
LTAIADKMPMATDDDDDWLGSLLSQEATKPVEPAPASAWKDKTSPEANLRQDLVRELAPTPADTEPTTFLPSVDSLSSATTTDMGTTIDEAIGKVLEETNLSTENEAEVETTGPIGEDLDVPSPDAAESPTVDSMKAEQASPIDQTPTALPVAFDPPAPPLNSMHAKDDARAACPAGQPKPKIDLKAMQKAKANQSPDQVARLFSGEKPSESSADKDESPSGPTRLSFETPVMGPKPLPKVLLVLDDVTQRARKVHSRLPLVAGLAGVAFLGHGLLIGLMATIGWI